jgi:hypothetical protein
MIALRGAVLRLSHDISAQTAEWLSAILATMPEVSLVRWPLIGIDTCVYAQLGNWPHLRKL